MRRIRKTWAETHGHIGPRDKCHVATCIKILRWDNQCGYCSRHQHIRWVKGPSGLTCAKCPADLRRDNKTGLCLRCRRGGRRVRPLIMLGMRCAVPGCQRDREFARVPLCPPHLEAWHLSFMRQKAAMEALRFLREAASPGAPVPAYSRAELAKLADALLGAGFGKTPSTDAWHRTRAFKDYEEAVA